MDRVTVRIRVSDMFRVRVRLEPNTRGLLRIIIDEALQGVDLSVCERTSDLTCPHTFACTYTCTHVHTHAQPQILKDVSCTATNSKS